jgi:hypothetical protein
VLLETELSLVSGAEASGTFTPERVGPYEVSIRIRNDLPTDELAAMIRGGWSGDTGPPGLVVTYVIRCDGEILTWGERRGSGGTGISRDYTTITVASVADGQPKRHEVQMRVEHAPTELAAIPAAMVVGPTGDWIHYAWFEAGMRGGLVNLALVTVVVASGLVWVIRRRRRRRAARMSAPS